MKKKIILLLIYNNKKIYYETIHNFLKKVLTNKGYFPRLIFDETTNTVSIQKNKDVTIPLGGNSSETDLTNYYDKTEVDMALMAKANTSDLSNYYDKTMVDMTLMTKVNTSDLYVFYYDKDFIDALILRIQILENQLLEP